MPADGDVVTHLSERHLPCESRIHGEVDNWVSENLTYGGPWPGWIGVRWGDGHCTRHPDANLVPCTCEGT